MSASPRPTASAVATRISTDAPIEIGGIEKMSKSKKNVVDPDDIIASYGADTARWFVLSDSPPERDVIWSEAGVEGAHRFVQRLWRLFTETAPKLPAAGSKGTPGSDGPSLDIRKAAHRTVAGVSDDIERLAFNKAIARVHELGQPAARPPSARSMPAMAAQRQRPARRCRCWRASSRR